MTCFLIYLHLYRLRPKTYGRCWYTLAFNIKNPSAYDRHPTSSPLSGQCSLSNGDPPFGIRLDVDPPAFSFQFVLDLKLQPIGSGLKELLLGISRRRFGRIPSHHGNPATETAQIHRAGIRIWSDYLDVLQGDTQFLSHNHRKDGIGTLSNIRCLGEKMGRAIFIYFYPGLRDWDVCHILV